MILNTHIAKSANNLKLLKNMLKNMHSVGIYIYDQNIQKAGKPEN